MIFTMNDVIPVIDFSDYSLTVPETSITTNSVEKLAQQLCEGFKNTGFVYLKQHGIDQEKVRCLSFSQNFFLLT